MLRYWFIKIDFGFSRDFFCYFSTLIKTWNQKLRNQTLQAL